MFSEIFFLQCALLCILYFIYTTKEIYYLIVNCIFFLGLVSILLWLFDADVYTNFLIIIDLGVFFVLLAFLLNLTKLFQSDTSVGESQRTHRKSIMITTSVLLFSLIGSLMFCNYERLSYFLYSWISEPICYDWFSLYNFVYFSDLQLLTEVYFHVNIFEFILMNLFIYVGILLIALTLNLELPNTSEQKNTLMLNSYLITKKFEKHLYQRSQNLQFQIKRSATVRAWGRHNFSLNDSTTDLNSINW